MLSKHPSSEQLASLTACIDEGWTGQQEWSLVQISYVEKVWILHNKNWWALDFAVLLY
jgi:hypothetical protein